MSKLKSFINKVRYIRDIILVILIGLIFGCQNSTPINEQIERIDLTNIEKNIATEEFILHKIIPLEFNENSIIGSIRKIEFHNDLMIIQNQRGGGQLVFFDFQGNFLGLIDKQGKGPGEYLEIRDFTINKKKDEILILDKNDRVHFFDLNYHFDRTIQIPQEYDHRRIASKGDFIYTSIFSSDSLNLCVSNYGGKLKDACFPSPRETFSIGRPFDLSGGHLSMKVKACDTIYELSMGSYFPRVLLDFGDKALPHSIAINTTQRRGVPQSLKYIMNTRFYETADQYLFNLIAYNHKINNASDFLGYYDKKSKQTIFFKKDEFVNELMPKGIFIWNTFQEKYYCTVFYPPLLHSYLDKINKENGNSIPQEYELLNKLCESHPIDSNPLVVLFEIGN